jgi:hypothetical protein
LLLMIIWSKANLIAAKMVRRIWSKTTNIYSRGGVPKAYLTPKRGGCNECARKSLWNDKQRLYQQYLWAWSRYGGPTKLFHRQLEEEVRYDW